MEDTERTLVVFLTMHRSGSSLTSGIFQALGMSLGPFELLGASPANVHGHFESIPFLELNRDVQRLVYGFSEDLPEAPEDVRRFVESDGVVDWPEISEDLLGRGRTLIESLLGSGRVSGFKDPRSVLVWPFWQRVLLGFPNLNIVPIALLRSPHEIAMSLFARAEGAWGYWDCLDVVAVHLRRLQAIVEEWSGSVPRIRFGGSDYFEDTELAIRQCGLDWEATKALRVFDGHCVHQVPASIDHRAQQIYDSLCGSQTISSSAERNSAQLQGDARARDEVYSNRLRSAKAAADRLTLELLESQARLNRADEHAIQAFAKYERTEAELLRFKAAYQDASNRADEASQLVLNLSKPGVTQVPLRYRVVDAINARIKHMGLIHSLAKGMVQRILGARRFLAGKATI
jgi:hypothetical protein